MRIGVPKEIKLQEHRIGLTPESVKKLTDKGHEVLVENNGGFEAGFSNEDYKNSGAKIENKASDIFRNSDLIVKVKEPQKKEIDMSGLLFLKPNLYVCNVEEESIVKGNTYTENFINATKFIDMNDLLTKLSIADLQYIGE